MTYSKLVYINSANENLCVGLTGLEEVLKNGDSLLPLPMREALWNKFPADLLFHKSSYRV